MIKNRPISAQRRYSSLTGTGVQYLPGHQEPFIDCVINNYLPNEGRIVDLAGGGLRFGVAAALQAKEVIVVDLDEHSISFEVIKKQIAEKDSRNAHNIDRVSSRITPIVQDALSFISETHYNFTLITSFRYIHFLNPAHVEQFFRNVFSKLSPGGICALSAITPYNFGDQSTRNEIYQQTDIESDDGYYRKFYDSEEAKEVQQCQNLQERIHFIDEKFIDTAANKFGFNILERNIPSTQIVMGYILQKI